jgi:RNA binding exosome subunit
MSNVVDEMSHKLGLTVYKQSLLAVDTSFHDEDDVLLLKVNVAEFPRGFYP